MKVYRIDVTLITTGYAYLKSIVMETFDTRNHNNT